MEISGEGLRGLVILSIFIALSVASAANTPSSVGTDIAKIISVNYLGADQWVEIADERNWFDRSHRLDAHEHGKSYLLIPGKFHP